MEKFSKWRPFLPLQAPSSSPLSLALYPFALAFGLVRVTLLAVLALLHFVLVDTLLAPLGAVARPLSSLLTALTARLALVLLGYYWIPVETVSAKRARGGVAQTAGAPRKGDLIIANWTSYVDVLFYAFRHNPTFLVPVFAAPAASGETFGRATGTGSASILLPSSSARCDGYEAVSALSLLARTGALPPTTGSTQGTVFKTLADARKAAPGPVLLFPEATTSNGRAVLRFGEGVLAEEVGKDGIVWIKFTRHAAPTTLLPTATCPIPAVAAHAFAFAATLPLPRSMAVRTLHPSAAPSSPSFLPSEVLASQPGGLAAAKDDKAVWREACGIVLAETGRVRRVPGMGWAEKTSFLEYYAKSRESRRR
ncbi:hypothetical protein VHUM_02942 [Vanrija humicola]|uniref:Phospholipid/glycerol acyltransferase domain-containing protein n=1 Tax=Vanrija humicola TaxID=5417 RepID=A0A7D8UYD6_VANHU|nr:hypothetical protein VHUM_02942 [Vanrija humicola]